MSVPVDNRVLIILLSFSCFLCLALLLLLLRFKPTSGRSKGKVGKQGRPPPSPPSLPLIGNLLWLRRPLLDLSPAVRRLAATYGPVVSLSIGPVPAVFIADRRLAHEALVAKGAAFSDRPRPQGANYVYSSDGHVISSASGSLWRLLRRNLSAEILHPSRLRSYAPGRRWALGKLLGSLRAEAEANGGVVVLASSFRNAVFSLMVYMCFGEKLDEKVIRDIMDVQRELLQLALALNIFDLMPRLAKFVFWKRWKAFLAIRRRQEDILIPLIRARRDKKLHDKMKHEQPIVSYVDTLLDLELPEEGGRKLDDLEIVSLCSEFFNAGTDTTSTTLQWVMANLVKFPDIQNKLLEEIRAVTGDSGDEIKEEQLQRMTFLNAVILEALRRHPPAHFLLPHIVSEEVSLKGYLISKGVAVNVTTAEFGWDETVWKDPMEFKPERFLPGGEGHGVDITGSREIKMMPFGAGRRICPGLVLALLHLECFVANLVREFEWKGVEGEVVDLSEELEFTVTMKNPLRASISPWLDR
uniref:Cytochrome P450 89A2 n=1 Tax=Anthurium amnicola TaxID=1678845 RepID=A0A1D1YKK2_9ARAE